MYKLHYAYHNFYNSSFDTSKAYNTLSSTWKDSAEKSVNTHRKHRRPILSPTNVRKLSAKARCHGSLVPRKEDAAWRAIVYRSTTTIVRLDNRAVGTLSPDPLESNCNVRFA